MWVFPTLLFHQRPGDRDVLWNDLGDDDPAADLVRFLRSDPPWCVASPLWARQSLQALGGFNARVMYGDDADLHVRAILASLPYDKRPEALPDVFIRRSDAGRITSDLTPELIESRAVRLVEGSRTLEAHRAAPEITDQWQGQYLVEAEFLLFHLPDPKGAIRRVLSAWTRLHRPTWRRRVIVRSYLSVAQACRRRGYLLLRIARRLAMSLLPEPYFPRGGQFETATVDAATIAEIRRHAPASA
jgi:hypothetical protein